jgi:hypothetical protein
MAGEIKTYSGISMLRDRIQRMLRDRADAIKDKASGLLVVDDATKALHNEHVGRLRELGRTSSEIDAIFRDFQAADDDEPEEGEL